MRATRAGLCRAQSGAAGPAGGVGCAGLPSASLVDKPGPAAFGAIDEQLVSRPQSRCPCSAGLECLDYSDRGRDRTAARRADLHDLSEDGLGDIAVLSDPAGADCDPVISAAENRAVSYCRDLAGVDARGTGRLAHHRGPRTRPESQQRIRLCGAFRACPRADTSLASAL